MRYKTYSLRVNSETVSAFPEQLKYIYCVGCRKPRDCYVEYGRIVTRAAE